MQVAIVTTGASIELIRSGKLRPLAMTTAKRLEVLPGIPTVAEFLPGHEASGWLGVGAPKNTPAAIVDIPNQDINAGLADSLELKSRLAESGNVALPLSPAGFGKLIDE